MSHASREDPRLDRPWYDPEPQTYQCIICQDFVAASDLDSVEPPICLLCAEGDDWNEDET